MAEASDIFEGATRLELVEDFAAPQTEPREQDLLGGGSQAGQPASTLGLGRITRESNMPLDLRLYDVQAEYANVPQPNGAAYVFTDPSLYLQPLNAIITAVDATNFTYSAMAVVDPAIIVTNQVPKMRPFAVADLGADKIAVTMSAVLDPCTIMRLRTGEVYLWDVPEIFGAEEACE
jgi:hypothetical protein